MSSDLDNGTLPSFAFIAPNLCNDTHNCKVSTGDAWLKDWMTRILESKTYAAGRTAVFITWDEGPDGSHGQDCFANSDDTCHIPTYVVGPAVGPGAKSGARFSHYSMLKTTEQMLGLRAYLGRAASAPSMRAAFGL